jgi:ribosomal RNA-processing protein 1
MLLRRWINASFRLLARSAWNPLIVQRYLTILVDPATGPLTYENPRTPVSLAWHLADIWVDELNKVLGDEEIVRFRSFRVPSPSVTQAEQQH